MAFVLQVSFDYGESFRVRAAAEGSANTHNSLPSSKENPSLTSEISDKEKQKKPLLFVAFVTWG